MNTNDAQFATEIDANTILVDCRGMKCMLHTQAGIVRALGDRHFNGEYKNDKEAFSRILSQKDGLYVYHIESVAKKVWIVSKTKLTSIQTQPIAKQYVAANPKRK